MGLASCTAKCLTSIFTLMIFIVGLLLLALGIFAATHLSAYIPVGPTPWIMIGIGVLVVFLGFAGFAMLCCPRRRKCSLSIMMVLTVVAFAMSAAGTGLGFYYNDIMETAFKHGFGDEVNDANDGFNKLEKSFYHGMRDTFQDLYKDCEPTSYYTTEVHAECDSSNRTDSVDVEKCSSDDYPLDRVGLYCKKGPGLDDFTVDVAMAFPDPDESLSIKDFINKRSFGYFANYACMPTAESYRLYLAEVDVIALGATPNTTFGGCYASSWWGETPKPVAAAGFTEQADGEPLTAGQASFFDALQAKGSKKMNDKMVFCLCSAEGQESKLYEFVEKASSYSKWIALGASIFFLLVFISECYLCCCYRDQSDRVMGKQLTVLRP